MFITLTVADGATLGRNAGCKQSALRLHAACIRSHGRIYSVYALKMAVMSVIY